MNCGDHTLQRAGFSNTVSTDTILAAILCSPFCTISSFTVINASPTSSVPESLKIIMHQILNTDLVWLVFKYHIIIPRYVSHFVYNYVYSIQQFDFIYLYLAFFLNFFCLLAKCFWRFSTDGNLNTSKYLLLP